MPGASLLPSPPPTPCAMPAHLLLQVRVLQPPYMVSGPRGGQVHVAGQGGQVVGEARGSAKRPLVAQLEGQLGVPGETHPHVLKVHQEYHVRR